jgi:hypothetical protein
LITLKPLLAAAAAITTFTALLTAAAPSVAAGSCSIIVPAKVSIKSAFTTITARPASDCAASDMGDASWVVSPSNFGDSFFFLASTLSDSYTFYSSIDRVGALRAVGTGASSSQGFNDLSQNSPTFVVKYGTWAYVNSSRSGTVVHVGGLLHQWSSNDMISPSGRRVYLQRYTGGAWHNLVGQTSNSAGRVSFAFIQRVVCQYRLTVAESTTAWSAASSSTFR